MIFSNARPLPTPENYQENYSLYEDYIVDRQNGYNELLGIPEVEYDAWVDVMEVVMHAKKPQEVGEDRRGAQYKLERLSQLGISFEDFDELNEAMRPPRLNEDGTREEQDIFYYRQQYAFALGFMQQQFTTEQLYGDEITYNMTFEMIRDVLNSRLNMEMSLQERFEARGEVLKALGEWGLYAMGYARGFVEKWALDMYPGDTDIDEMSRQTFITGHGVALHGARLAHETINGKFLSLINIDELEPSEFISTNINNSSETE